MNNARAVSSTDQFGPHLRRCSRSVSTFLLRCAHTTMAAADLFQWVTAPQPTVLRGQPLIPVPTVSFKPTPFRGFPLVNAASAVPAFYVSCFVLDKDAF